MKARILIPSSKEITRKGNGRIFVQNDADIEKVHKILRGINKEEYDGYLPSNFIAVFNPDGNNKLVYTHKFDLNVGEFIAKCKEEDIYVLVYSCNEYHYDDMLTLESHVQKQLGIVFIDDFTYNKTK